MIAAAFLCAALFCGAIWLFMVLVRMEVLNGLWRRTWMIGTVGFAVLAAGLGAMGV